MYYKVVTVGLRSIVIYEHDLVTQYRVGEFVYPQLEHSKLFVFKDLHAAQTFASIELGVVYECEVKNPSKFGFCSIFIRTSYILKGWKLRRQKKKFSNLQGRAPDGTVYAGAVKLVKEVV